MEVLNLSFIEYVKQLTAWEMYTKRNSSGTCSPFCLFISESQDVWGKCIGHKMCIPFLSITFLQNIFHLDSYPMNYAQDAHRNTLYLHVRCHYGYSV